MSRKHNFHFISATQAECFDGAGKTIEDKTSAPAAGRRIAVDLSGTHRRFRQQNETESATEAKLCATSTAGSATAHHEAGDLKTVLKIKGGSRRIGSSPGDSQAAWQNESGTSAALWCARSNPHPAKDFKTEGSDGAIRVSYDDIDLLKVLNMERSRRRSEADAVVAQGARLKRIRIADSCIRHFKKRG
jgi:hypothetical protein